MIRFEFRVVAVGEQLTVSVWYSGFERTVGQTITEEIIEALCAAADSEGTMRTIFKMPAVGSYQAIGYGTYRPDAIEILESRAIPI